MARYHVEYLGVDHSQYFTGVSASYTEWDDVYVGVGSTPREAVDDACESAAQNGIDAARIGRKRWSDSTPRELARAYKECGEDGECELYCYAVLYVKDTMPRLT